MVDCLLQGHRRLPILQTYFTLTSILDDMMGSLFFVLFFSVVISCDLLSSLSCCVLTKHFTTCTPPLFLCFFFFCFWSDMGPCHNSPVWSLRRHKWLPTSSFARQTEHCLQHTRTFPAPKCIQSAPADQRLGLLIVTHTHVHMPSVPTAIFPNENLRQLILSSIHLLHIHPPPPNEKPNLRAAAPAAVRTSGCGRHRLFKLMLSG